MPQRKSNQEDFYYSRTDIEKIFEDLFNKTINCDQCKKCIHCKRAEFVDFEADRKMFYTSNRDVLAWKIRWQGKIKRLVILPVF